MPKYQPDFSCGWEIGDSDGLTLDRPYGTVYKWHMVANSVDPDPIIGRQCEGVAAAVGWLFYDLTS